MGQLKMVMNQAREGVTIHPDRVKPHHLHRNQLHLRRKKASRLIGISVLKPFGIPEGFNFFIKRQPVLH